jgi:hypothetical protein
VRTGIAYGVMGHFGVSSRWAKKGTIMLHITNAEYVGNYQVRVKFNDGREGVADLQTMVFDEKPGSVLAPLRDPAVFGQFALQHGTLCWPGEVDVAPEYIYFLAFRDDGTLRHLFEEWGYIESPIAV